MTIRPFLFCIIALLCGALLSGCGSRSWHKGGVPGSRPYTVRGKTYYPLKSATGFVEEGTASWYGPGFHGKTTANGETYNQYAMTAAHKILPLGTQVRVTHLGNGRSVVVRVNDRGPFLRGRVIDLSQEDKRSTSEGQAYAMFFALVANDQAMFDRLLGWTKRLAKEAPLLIYCYHGNASKTYAQMFADFHFTRVFSIDGGYPALEMAFSAAEA